MIIHPSFVEFERLTRDHSVVPVWGEIPADLETPVSAFLKMRKGNYNFLLESVEQEEKMGRYTFLGTDPEEIVFARGGRLTVVNTRTGEKETVTEEDPLAAVERRYAHYFHPPVAGLPELTGGLIGYLSYDYVRVLERLPLRTKDDLDAPDFFFMLARNIAVFDHFKRRLLLIANAIEPAADPKAAYERSLAAIETMRASLAKSLFIVQPVRSSTNEAPHGDVTRQEYTAAVVRAKEYVRAGDIIQVVLSQRWRKRFEGDPFNVYRALRSVNPSPYMFYLETGDFKLIGSSPEILVRLQGRTATVRPIAGTRPRGKNDAGELAMERELLNDAKERAEHVMLVDLGRNDLGRVCAAGSITVTELMGIEKYSHVMHLVSNVEGRLKTGKNAFDLLRATFPAGTVTGAPKIRAMEIIEEQESLRRGPYAGAVGYFSFQRTMDFCITIRTLFARGHTIYAQAGAGIVADSVPEREYTETVNKAAGLMEALKRAEEMAA